MDLSSFLQLYKHGFQTLLSRLVGSCVLQTFRLEFQSLKVIFKLRVSTNFGRSFFYRGTML